jgi:hypothetical protein
MKKLFFLLLISCGVYLCDAQDFSKAEYFFDADLGAGSGTPISLSATVTPMSFTSTVSIAALSPGFHILGIRVKENGGPWSLFESRGFIVSVVGTNSVNVAAAEYFFDIDPGEGNGVSISVTTGASSSFTIVTPTGSLLPGFHFLAIRAKGVDGKWSVFESRGFYITSTASNVTGIAAAEYFFDTDPGTGNATVLTIPNGAISNFTASLPATGLSSGFHFLVVRTKNAEGKWSVFESRGFYVQDEPTAPINIIALEYFVDADPGQGNGTQISFTTPSSNVDEAFEFKMPANLSASTHTLGVRVLDDRGRWSFDELGAFNMIANSIPVAIAGNDQSITLPLNSVTLDGTSSTDADGSISYYFWTKVSGPTPATITSPFHSVTEVTDLVEGVYAFELRVVDNVTVSGRDTVKIIVNNGSCPTTPLIVQNDDQLAIDDDNSTYQWFMNGEAIDGATTNALEISLLEYGVYAVEATKNGCTIRSGNYVYLITGSSYEKVVCKIFPNPSKEFFFISISNLSQPANMNVIDVLGRVVYSAKIKNGLNVIDDSLLSQSIYFVIIDGGPVNKIEKR